MTLVLESGCDLGTVALALESRTDDLPPLTDDHCSGAYALLVEDAASEVALGCCALLSGGAHRQYRCAMPPYDTEAQNFVEQLRLAHETRVMVSNTACAGGGLGAPWSDVGLVVTLEEKMDASLVCARLVGGLTAVVVILGAISSFLSILNRMAENHALKLVNTHLVTAAGATAIQMPIAVSLRQQTSQSANDEGTVRLATAALFHVVLSLLFSLFLIYTPETRAQVTTESGAVEVEVFGTTRRVGFSRHVLRNFLSQFVTSSARRAVLLAYLATCLLQPLAGWGLSVAVGIYFGELADPAIQLTALGWYAAFSCVFLTAFLKGITHVEDGGKTAEATQALQSGLQAMLQVAAEAPDADLVGRLRKRAAGVVDRASHACVYMATLAGVSLTVWLTLLWLAATDLGGLGAPSENRTRNILALARGRCLPTRRLTLRTSLQTRPRRAGAP
jgi:hypothetical protein